MKRISLKARTGLALTALAVPMALTGCVGGTPTSGNQAVTSISVMDFWGSNPPGGLNECAARAGVTLQREAAPFEGYLPKVLQQVSSKTLPDLLMLNDPDISKIAAIGALAPLSDYNISSDGFAQGAVEAGTYDGKLYGLLPTDSPNALFYNKDLFAKAGIQPPTTWDELKAAAAKLTSGGQYGIALTAKAATGPTSSAFLPFVWSNGGDETNIDTPQFAEALQLWTDLVQSGSASSSALTWNGDDVMEQFVAGKAAMVITEAAYTPSLDKVSGLHYGIVKIPVKSASDTAVAGVADPGWTVPRTGNKAGQAKAAEIVACLTSDEMQLSTTKDNGQIPTKTTLAPQFAAEHPQLAVFVDIMKTSRARSAKLGPDWPKTETQIYTAIQTALTGKASPADALKQAKNNG